ncbi:metallophosphoesterase [Arthrobacter sp. M4]|uniref:metallophosphoesterase family protein n=1 Tax=Arthrobacter sp. M4 TaxID=218160 RepID=UPI001CDB8EC1|nr:metallophosphoesterase [Arthrobacter sp. M4]MCA4131285.1 metallophosphoesterase [Arthrobacter sp. M4]
MTACLASDQRGVPIDPAWNAMGPVAPMAAQIPAESGRLHITAAGDYAAFATTRKVLSRIRSVNPDLNLALGDLSYGNPGTERSWCDLVVSEVGPEFPFELLAGNHESSGEDGLIDNFAACLPNRLPGLVGDYGRQFYVDVPQKDPLVRIVAISPGIPFPDGEWDYSTGTARYRWTATAIDGARAAHIPWVIAIMHTPCLSVGQYTCPAGKPITDLLVAKKVDLVLSGHEHLYQRTMQLDRSAACPGITPKSFVAACIKDGGNTLSKGAGTVFVSAGTGGKELREVNKSDSEMGYFAAYSGTNVNPSHGFLDLQLTATQLTAGFVPVDGDFTDSFNISR